MSVSGRVNGAFNRDALPVRQVRAWNEGETSTWYTCSCESTANSDACFRTVKHRELLRFKFECVLYFDLNP